MRMADQQNLDMVELKAERLHVPHEHGLIFRLHAVDADIAL